MSWTSVIHSFCLSAGATLLAGVFGLAGALWLAGAGRGARWAGRLAATLCLAIPPFLSVNCWLDFTAGWRALERPETLALIYLPLACVVLAGMLSPLTLFLADGALRGVEAACLESDSELRGWALLRHAVWPAVRGPAAAGAVITAALSLSNFTVPTLFQVRVFTEEFWLRFNTQLDLRGAVAAAWPLALLPAAVALGWRANRAPRRWGRESAPRALWCSRLGPVRPVAGAAYWAWVGLVLLAPLFRLLATARTWAELGPAAAAGQSAIVNAVILAAVPATTALALGLWLGGAPRRPRFPRLAWFWFFAPGVFLGVACIEVFNRPPFLAFYRTLGMPATALVLRWLPLAWAAAAAAAAQADPAPEELLRIEGADAVRAALWARWPQGAPVLAGAWLGLFLLGLWDVETIVLVQPPAGETLALRVFNFLHYGHAAQVNALCLIALGLAALGALAAAGLARLRLPAARAARAAATMAMLAGLAGSGCAPRPETLSAALDSKLFSGARTLGDRGTAPGQFNKPRSLACDLADNLYVVDITGRIQKFAPDGRWLAQWQMPEIEVGKPKGMGRDPRGNLLVVEPHYQRVNHFTPEGKLAAQWGAKGTNIGELILPRAIAVDSHGEYFVTDYSLVDRVQRFAVDWDAVRTTNLLVAGVSRPTPRIPWKSVRAWGEPGYGPGQFNRAEGVAVDDADRVYVADSCNHRVQVFDREGGFLLSFGQAGSGAGSLSYPYDVCVDREGWVVVCEFGNSRLSIFDRRGRLIETIGRAGAGAGEFANPWSITLDSHGNLYVADAQNNRVQKLTRRPGYPGGRVAAASTKRTAPPPG